MQLPRLRRRSFWALTGLTWFVFFLVREALALEGQAPLATAWAGVAVLTIGVLAVARLHDRGRSGWWLAAVLVPLAGAIWLAWELALRRGISLQIQRLGLARGARPDHRIQHVERVIVGGARRFRRRRWRSRSSRRHARARATGEREHVRDAGARDARSPRRRAVEPAHFGDVTLLEGRASRRDTLRVRAPEEREQSEDDGDEANGVGHGAPHCRPGSASTVLDTVLSAARFA